MAEYRIEKIDEAAYGSFLEANPPQDPFSTPSFLAACRDVFSVELIYLSILKSDTPIAVCSLSAGKRLWYPIVQLIPGRTYDGVHFRALTGSTNQKQEYERLFALQTLEKFLEQNFSFHQLVFLPGSIDIRAHQWAGATVFPHFTYIVDLHDFSEQNYTKSLKEVVRAARDAGLKPGECTVEELTELQQLSYERHGRSAPLSVDALNRLLGKLNEIGYLKIIAVRNGDGELLSALARIQTKTGSYFYVSGTRPLKVEAEKGASHLVYHEILIAEKEAGRSYVDFCGANTPSINLFKSAFGPKLQIYFRIVRANDPFIRAVSHFKKI